MLVDSVNAEALAVHRPGSRGSCRGSSRGHNSHGSRESSRGSSRGSGGVCDELFATAGAAAESASAEAAAMLAWQQQAVLAVEQLSSLPVSPAAADAAALLRACATLQTLLDTAEDQQCLQKWLATPAQAAALAAAAGPGQAGLAQGGSADVRGVVVAALVRLVDCPKADVVMKVRERGPG